MADFNSLFNYKNSLFEFVRELLCKPLKTPLETAGSQSQTPQSPKIRCIFPGNREIRISETGSLVTASSSGESANFQFLNSNSGASHFLASSSPPSAATAVPR